MFEMKIKVEIEGLGDILAALNNFSSVVASLNAPVAPVAVVEEPVVEEAPKKRTRKAKAAAPVAEEAPAPVKEPEPAPAAEENPPVDEPVTKEMLQHACIDSAKRVGKEKTMAAIKSFGYSGLSQVPEEKYRQLYVTIQGLQ